MLYRLARPSLISVWVFYIVELVLVLPIPEIPEIPEILLTGL
jgi:hypothetical protein